MRKLIARIAILAVCSLALIGVAGAAPASAAANCHLSVSSYFQSGHPAAQVTFDTCTDVDKIQQQYGAAINGLGFTLGSCACYWADHYQGINACGSNGWQTVPGQGVTFTCQSSGTICGAVNAGCSMWGYVSTQPVRCIQSVWISYRLHRWSTNTWGTWQGPATPWAC